MSLTVRPTAWYDPSNGVVSTDKDDPRFTPLGQLLPLYPVPEAPEPIPQPVAYISGYHKGRCIIEPIDRNVLLPVGMALYRSPPKREPLTEEQIESAVCNAYVEKALTRYDITIARAIERAHGIGGEE